jgi:hypothetical protein
MKSIDAQSCRALKSRGSRTSRRIVIRTSTNGLPNQEAVPRILFCAQRNTPIFICDSPAVPRIGTLALAGASHSSFSLDIRDDRFPRSTTEPDPGSRRLQAGRRSGRTPGLRPNSSRRPLPSPRFRHRPVNFGVTGVTVTLYLTPLCAHPLVHNATSNPAPSPCQ